MDDAVCLCGEILIVRDSHDRPAALVSNVMEDVLHDCARRRIVDRSRNALRGHDLMPRCIQVQKRNR